VSLDRVVVIENLDAVAPVGRDDVPGRGGGPADGAAKVVDLNPRAAVAQRAGTRGIGADQVALNHGVWGPTVDAVVAVAGDDVPRPRRRSAADGIVGGRAEENTIGAVAQA